MSDKDFEYFAALDDAALIRALELCKDDKLTSELALEPILKKRAAIEKEKRCAVKLLDVANKNALTILQILWHRNQRTK